MRAFGLPGNRGHKQHLAFMQGHAQASGGRELNVANWARSKQCTQAWVKGYKKAKLGIQISTVIEGEQHVVHR